MYAGADSEEQTIANVVDVSYSVVVTTGVSASVCCKRLNILPVRL
jgi:hypothetical protein